MLIKDAHKKHEAFEILTAEGFLMSKTRLLEIKLGKQQAAGFPLGEREQRDQQQGSPRLL